MTERRRLVGACGALAALALIAVLVRVLWVRFPIGYRLTGFMISDAGFAVQLTAIVAGIAAVHTLGAAAARSVLAAEGIVCTLGYGRAGVVYLVVVALWYVALAQRRGRLVLLAVLLAAVEATSVTSLHDPGFLFSRLFTLRLLLFAWDRWQNEFARAHPLDYAAYMLLPPLVLLPNLVTIAPMFDGAVRDVRVGLTRERLRAAAGQLALAVAFVPVATGLARVPSVTGVPPAALLFVEGVVHTAILGHLSIALLVLHGIDERLPLARPLLATSYVELWSRYLVHLKDIQVALFYAPALLACRRLDRYVGIVIAIAWTMLVGNFAIHAVVGYAFYAANGTLTLEHAGWVCVQNGAIGVALACELCLREWRRRHGAPPPARWRTVVGWAATMAIATSATAIG